MTDTTTTALEIPGYRAGTWILDPSHSEVGFTVRHMMISKVRGHFAVKSATLIAPENPLEAKVEAHVDAASLDTKDEGRDQHLRSADFFDVERFGQITVVVNALHPATGKSAELHTHFTIKGITEPVSLPVTITELDDGSVRVSGRTQIDRSRFDLDWNKLGVMSNAVTVSAEAVFVHPAQTA